jgi:hypothetical protein
MDCNSKNALATKDFAITIKAWKNAWADHRWTPARPRIRCTSYA